MWGLFNLCTGYSPARELDFLGTPRKTTLTHCVEVIVSFGQGKQRLLHSKGLVISLTKIQGSSMLITFWRGVQSLELHWANDYKVKNKSLNSPSQPPGEAWCTMGFEV